MEFSSFFAGAFLFHYRLLPSTRKDAEMPKAVKDYTSPPHKIIAMLYEGRDKLRKKYTELKRQLRAAENQIRAVEKSREMWRQRAKEAEAEKKRPADHGECR